MWSDRGYAANPIWAYYLSEVSHFTLHASLTPVIYSSWMISDVSPGQMDPFSNLSDKPLESSAVDDLDGELFWTLYNSKARVHHKDMFEGTSNDLDALLTFVRPSIDFYIASPL